MIKLTDETRVVKKKTMHHEVGDVVDNSLYLVRIDDNNLALKRGNTVENYFGCVRTALKRSLNYAIKGSSEALNIESMLKTINGIDEAINKLESSCIKECDGK